MTPATTVTGLDDCIVSCTQSVSTLPGLSPSGLPLTQYLARSSPDVIAILLFNWSTPKSTRWHWQCQTAPLYHSHTSVLFRLHAKAICPSQGPYQTIQSNMAIPVFRLIFEQFLKLFSYCGEIIVTNPYHFDHFKWYWSRLDCCAMSINLHIIPTSQVQFYALKTSIAHS